MAEKNDIEAARQAAAAEALVKRYKRTPKRDNQADLREALLGAMGALKNDRLAPLLRAALKDPAATLRLSAVKGLRLLGHPQATEHIVPLLADTDRGVRLAALTAVGDLGVADHLDYVMARTEATGEPDEAVRRQAWTVAMTLAAGADAAKLRALADRLGLREDAGQYLIAVLKLWADMIPADDIDDWTGVRLRLCEALLAAPRPAEAAKELAIVHDALVKAGRPDAAKVRRRWIEALLAAGDALAVTRIAETKDAAEFAAALEAMQARIKKLREAKDWDAVIRLAGAAAGQLEKRLDDAQRKALADAMAEASAQRRQADRRRVSDLVARMTGEDKAARDAAGKELIAMNGRAVAPLVAELQVAVVAAPPSPQKEEAIVDLLASLAPELKGYDSEATLADRLKTIKSWLTQLGAGKTP